MPNDETPWRPTPEEIAAAHNGRLRDVLQPGLLGVLCGINPSLYSAAVNRHFARPGNRFWPALFRSGITPTQLSPFEDHRLPEFGFGLTNMVARATAKADELERDEHIRGRRSLANKLAKFQPRSIAILGISSFRAAFGISGKVVVGPQEQTIANVPVYVLPNPSGLNAHYQLDDLARIFRDFKNWSSRLPNHDRL